MRNPDRIDSFLEKLKEYWHKVPDWGFIQLISNVLGTCKYDPFFLEENETLELFKKYFTEPDKEDGKTKES